MGISVAFVRVRDAVRDDMKRAGIEAFVGPDNFYERSTDGVRAGQREAAVAQRTVGLVALALRDPVRARPADSGSFCAAIAISSFTAANAKTSSSDHQSRGQTPRSARGRARVEDSGSAERHAQGDL